MYNFDVWQDAINNMKRSNKTRALALISKYKLPLNEDDMSDADKHEYMMLKEEINNILAEQSEKTSSLPPSASKTAKAPEPTEYEEEEEEEEIEENDIDYSRYGPGFSRDFINRMLNDEDFKNILQNYIIPNEKGYVNDKDDSGGETNMGISKKVYKNENIKELTRERANALYYKNYYLWNGLNKLPNKIKGFIIDFGVVSSPQNAIETTHRVLNIPEGTIIGNNTLNKLKNFTNDDYAEFLEKYQKEMIDYFHTIVKKYPEKKKFLKGWISRANRAHLSK